MVKRSIDESTTEEELESVENEGCMSVVSECKVHRCRFLKYEPSTITTVAFNVAGDKLAVARQNGDVELWNVHERECYFDAVVGGRSSAVISSVQWTDSNRLFVASLDGTIREIDLDSLRFVNSLHANGGPIWCMQYHSIDNMLAVGCEDGRIRLFTMDEDEPLYFHKVFGGTNRRVISLAWHARTDTLFSGNDEGVIYHWNTKTGRNESRMTLERFSKQDPAVVWTLNVLDDMTVLSGDSNGNVHTWDGITGTLMQTFAQLTADVLTMAVNTTETLLFASGIDNQVIQLRRSPTTKLWSYAYSHRAHTHDVRALAVSRNEDEPLLVSGGVDTHLVTYPSSKFHIVRPNKISPIPPRQFIALASQKRLLLVQHSNSLDVWTLANESPKLLAHINVQGTYNIVSCAISPNGEFIACSTAAELKVFHLQGTSIKKVALSSSVSNPAYSLLFTADSAHLITGDTALRVIDMTTLSLIKTLATPHQLQTKTLCVSNDGQWVACGDIGNNISVFNLDAMLLYAEFPRPNDMHSALAFHPSGKILVVTTVSNNFACYDVERKSLTDWSRENAHKLPKELFLRQSSLMGVLFHPTQPNSIVLWSQRFLLHIDIDQPIGGQHVTKRRRTMSTVSVHEDSSSDDMDNAGGEPTYHFIDNYGPMAFVGFLSSTTTPELVVVETPFFKMLHALPDALQRPKYGH
ncbi:U3 small nucleolar RNA-associated protein [Thraustotheca clavata]|uniref:U3 small nucleolar RNA-associated protein n=1 Tax=Thraustotheca clavata TaxID=74557 RepID=A0A1V9ZWJ7_9STRA|nr:U3 small nucleolar RNA-associated protein [Thraustotheca clavata]